MPGPLPTGVLPTPLRRGSLAGPGLLVVVLAVAGGAWNAVLAAWGPPETRARTVAGQLLQQGTAGTPAATTPAGVPAPGPTAPASAAPAIPGLPPKPALPSSPRSPQEIADAARTAHDLRGALPGRGTVSALAWIWRIAPLVSQALQGACLGAVAVLLAGVLLRAKTGKARVVAAVGLSAGAFAAEPLVFLGQWLPAGLADDWTRKMDEALSGSLAQYVTGSVSHIEGAALAAGGAFPIAILLVKGWCVFTGRRHRGAVMRLGWLGVPALVAVRLGQRILAPLPGGGVRLDFAQLEVGDTLVPAVSAAVFAWLSLAWGAPRVEGTAAPLPAPAPPAPPPAV